MINFEEYDKILIGIGDEFNHTCDEKMDAFSIYKYVKGSIKEEIIEAYNRLSELVDGKDYYIVTTCTDDCIYESRINADKIVSPCGGFAFMQCPDDCSHELLPFEQSLLNGDIPVCPHCGKKVVFNRLPVDKYNEGGYLDKWELYSRWLQTTINKKLLILELGVGTAYPSVIRFPFEKTAYFNNKCKMIRVHKSLAFATPEIKDKCQCVSGDSVEFLKSL